MISVIKSHPALKLVRGRLVELPCPRRISRWWNFGSLLSLCLAAQLVTGVFLALNFTGDVTASFERVSHLCQDVRGGWLLRVFHANGARFFFICLYSHVRRGLYYGSYSNHSTWGVGVVILLLVIATAFLGYVLPWGQISFWGTTVITNLLSAIPYIGSNTVIWLWGGFAVINPTLTRFFAFHFLVPFIISGIVLGHLLFLHQTGSSNPLGLRSNFRKISFQPYFTSKDVIGRLILILGLGALRLSNPWALGDPENFIPANPIVTPVHIQPEWYFLFAYAVLRAIPNKLGGVLALVAAVIVLFVCTIWPQSNFSGLKLYPARKWVFWVWIIIVCLLTWIGARPVEEPFVSVGQALTLSYFMYFLACPLTQIGWDQAGLPKRKIIFSS